MPAGAGADRQPMPPRKSAHPRRSRALRWLVACLVLIVAAAGAYRLYLSLTRNFHEVVAGEVYRSAQPSAMRLANWQQSHGIRTVLNLRGANPGKDWYDEEAAAARTLGLQLIDYKLSSDIVATNDQMRELVRIMAEAPKPLLIHCKEGADRAGLASALYLAAIANAGEDAAEWQLTFLYGHASLPVIPAYAMDESWENMEVLLDFAESE
jgi:protein tyrosine/serine phosphatase